MGRLNLADWVDCTEVEGPGKRFALWVQGCKLQCPGCCNPHMFEFAPRHLVDSNEVIAWIDKSQKEHGIEGVTFLGGEPVLQARGLADVAAGCQARGLSVMVFTGHTIEYLHNRPIPGVQDLLKAADLLVDGPFVAQEYETRRNWAGSANQRFHFLTARYRPGIEWDTAYAHGFEVRVYGDGTVRTIGACRFWRAG